MPAKRTAKRQADLLQAAAKMDWMQVVLNGGPPCFHLEGNRFCGRAQRWDGHSKKLLIHEYVSLADLIWEVRDAG